MRNCWKNEKNTKAQLYPQSISTAWFCLLCVDLGMDPRLVEIHNSCVSPFHILIETPRDKKSHVFSKDFNLLYLQSHFRFLPEPWRPESHLVFNTCNHMWDSYQGDLIFVTNITNIISGEKFYKWKSFSFPCILYDNCGEIENFSTCAKLWYIMIS